MCMQCLANADAVVASGILGVAGARVSLRARWRARAAADPGVHRPPTDDPVAATETKVPAEA
jgi:hypothetical protein